MEKNVKLVKMEYKNSLFSVYFSFDYDEFDHIEVIFVVENKVIYSDLLSVKAGQSEQIVSIPLTEENNGKKLRIFYNSGLGKILIGSKTLMSRAIQTTGNNFTSLLNSLKVKDIQRDFKSQVDDFMNEVFN